MKNPFRSNKGRRCCSQSQLVFKPMWKCISFLGMRRFSRIVKTINPAAYGDTICHFNPPKPVIALTIDDGLSRGGMDTSMAAEVFCLLKKYNAHATFFVCTDYVKDQEASVQALLQHGHELGNHLQSDKLWYYPKLAPEEFKQELQGANQILRDLDKLPSTKTRWFRAPQGIMNKGMQQVVAEDETTTHVLGDCYCDDWCFSEEVDPLFDDGEDSPKQRKQREKAMKQVANLMLSQVKIGSVAILHMPEKGFRQGNLLALEYFLQGIQEKGLSCVNLTEMQETCFEAEATGEYVDDSDADNEDAQVIL